MIVDDRRISNDSPCLPSPHYKRVIVYGSKEHQLPLEYHKRLEAMPHNGFPGPVFIPLSIFHDGHLPNEIE